MNTIRKAVVLVKDGKFDYIFKKAAARLGIINYFVSSPVIINIEPTNFCNLKCPTCPTGSGRSGRPGRIISYEEFKKIIDNVKGQLERIVLWNYGEPFLNKELITMIRYAVESGIFVETSTNGEFFLSREFCSEVVDSGLQKLIVCLDGADQETIGKFRKGSHFDRIMEGIQLMVNTKKGLNAKTPEIEFQFIVMKHNEHQRERMKEIATGLGVDLYCEKTVGVDSSDPDFQNMAREMLPTDLSLSRFYQKEDGTFALRGDMANFCSRIFFSTVINSDGSVVPCCYDLYSRHVMGNVFEESLEKIWRNTKYRDFRRQLLKDRKSIPMCKICSEGRYEIRKRGSVT
jgi:radical SAM protein with 4Fe4S-binding SPASM domain